MNTNNQETEREIIQELVQQGKVLLGNENFEEALSCFDRALALNPMVYDAYVSKSIALASTEHLDSAMDCLKKAIKLDKENPDAYFHMGNISFMQGLFQQGVKEYNQAITLGYDEPDIYFHFGLVYEEISDFESATRYYSQAIRRDEMNPVFHLRKVVSLVQLAKFEEALEAVNELGMIAAESYEYYHLKTIILTQLDKTKEAEKLLDEANKLFPNDFDLMMDHIRLLVGMGENQRGLELTDRALKNVLDDDGKKDVLAVKGRLYAAMEEIDQAVVVLEEALKTGNPSPTDFEVHYLLINIYQMQKNYDAVVIHADALSNIDIASTESSYLLSGPYYSALGRKLRGDSDFTAYYDSASKKYRKLAMDEPSRLDAYLFRAICYKDVKNYKRALEMLDYILALQPQLGACHYIKAEIYKEMGDKENAQKESALASGSKDMDLLTSIVGEFNG